jgi:hypothetical protein
MSDAISKEANEIADALDETADRITRFSNNPGDGICTRAAQLLRILASPTTAPIELSGVKEALESSDGFWRTCSGCYESEDGHPVGDYPYSAILNCDLGAGCSECGGIGAVWDNTDYDAMVEFGEKWMANVASQVAQPDETTMHECMVTLLARTEAAEADAFRYRYLRERSLEAVQLGGVFAGKTPDNVVLNGADLDSEIDAESGVSFRAIPRTPTLTDEQRAAIELAVLLMSHKSHKETLRAMLAATKEQ